MAIAVPDLDPDLAAIPTGAPAAYGGVGAAENVRLIGVTFTNGSGAARTVTVTDNAGVALLNAVDLPSSGIPFVMELPFCRLLGLKCGASGANVTGKLWGYKVWPF